MNEVSDRADIQERYTAVIEQFNKMMDGIQSEKMLRVKWSEVEAWLLTEGQELFRRILQEHERQKEANDLNAGES